MTAPKILMLGIEPSLIHFDDPAYAAFPGLDAAKVHAGLDRDLAELTRLGFDASLCLVDFGETAADVLRQRLTEQRYDCISMGAGLRLIPQNTPLFEQLINLIHHDAPQAKLGFNTGPTDTAEAVLRWVPAVG